MLLYVTCNLLISYPVNNLGRLKDANKHLIFVFCFLLSLYCQNTLLSLIMLLTTSCKNAFIHEFSSDGIWVINRASFCLHLGRSKKQKLWHKPYESLVCSIILLRFFYKFFFFLSSPLLFLRSEVRFNHKWQYCSQSSLSVWLKDTSAV